MQPSAITCRAQGELQLARAKTSTLVNVQQQAFAAAAAWFKEAEDAEKRELRRDLVKARAAADARLADMMLDGGTSENPDRGLSGGAAADGPEVPIRHISLA